MWTQGLQPVFSRLQASCDEADAQGSSLRFAPQLLAVLSEPPKLITAAPRLLEVPSWRGSIPRIGSLEDDAARLVRS